MLAELLGLASIAIVLGMRHGLDADHLATIDGLTRSRAHSDGQRIGGCGLWFSAGHGIAIISMGTLLAALGEHAASPAWLHESGTFVAATALVMLGSFNLWSAWRAAPGTSHHPISIKRWLARRLNGRVGGPLGMLGLGGLFAVSFDAVAVAALFAASATALGQAWVAAALGAAFSLGMSTVDGLAGWCCAWMIRRSHSLTPQGPRVSGMLLGIGCIATAATLLVEPLLTSAAGFSESQALVLSACVALMVPLTYGVTWWFVFGPGRPGQSNFKEYRIDR